MAAKHPVEQLIQTRKRLPPAGPLDLTRRQMEAEGGCGVIGIACSEPIAGRHLLQALDQMRNRGNGKGGGIAAVGLSPEEFGVSRPVLENDYLLIVAYLEPDVREAVERDHIHPTFEIDHLREQNHVPDHTDLPGLDVRPPEVVQYFVRVRPEMVEQFRSDHSLEDLPPGKIEDEIVYQNSYRLNAAHYAAGNRTEAFVLSHGKNLLVLKMVGYGDDVVRYYGLEDLHAHVWIGHHRYPTKGRVWHPGGAHPFVGLNEALVHNGDFANYASICEYLAQRNIYPLFLTDTEVSVLVFDLLHRLYDYPLEYVIEALAPTTERDFALLPAGRQDIYKMLQTTHIHTSPDGPWFFLIAQSDPERRGGEDAAPRYRLIGITDTSMLRPQVFAWQDAGESGPAVGFAASEKQAIDAALQSLAQEDPRFCARADLYWNARGGSHTDGGAFVFTVSPNGAERRQLVCTDKFGHDVRDTFHLERAANSPELSARSNHRPARSELPDISAPELFNWITASLPEWSSSQISEVLTTLARTADQDESRRRAIETCSLLIDRRYPVGAIRRSRFLAQVDDCLNSIFRSVQIKPSAGYVASSARVRLSDPAAECQTVVIDGREFPPEGPESLALEIVRLHNLGYQKIIVMDARGHRFLGSGLGAGSDRLRIDIYGSPGDYLGSGIDGAELQVHNNAQDQAAQIIKRGKLVIYGDVGQTFMYAAKGGEAYVLGNAAGRPLINAVGKPRVVINGTCLDYLAESFMAGDPYNGGGFVVLNGLAFDPDGSIRELETPYPGGNLFSLASGGALFIRDPHQRLTQDQLNGGEFAPLERSDWELIQPYLQENERVFGLPVARLLKVGDELRAPEGVYRKVRPVSMRALQAEEAWVRKH